MTAHRIGLLFLLLGLPGLAGAQSALPGLDMELTPMNSPDEVATGLRILALLTVLTLAPAILVLMTSFVRVVVVLSFLRQALGTQQTPPNQVIIGLSLFLTLFIMAPVWQQIDQEALGPYLDNQISFQEGAMRALEPAREFMFAQAGDREVRLFMNLAGEDKPADLSEIPTRALIPAFVISELKTAFEIGFLIYIPFLIIDMVVASVLMSMGMMMLPPVMISLPMKLILFVLVDGWYLIVGSLVESFQ
ncbi:flagellar type III secretion system pore protein FliP [Thiohalorhabdus methylotrophus]|uniref:Flagellar biosynthetic protein FliP n=1 Tax=Thiohalorhabdus methylotrophus TaxID=3242694 RepID=A0ABV4TZA4_9GAMM